MARVQTGCLVWRQPEVQSAPDIAHFRNAALLTAEMRFGQLALLPGQINIEPPAGAQAGDGVVPTASSTTGLIRSVHLDLAIRSSGNTSAFGDDSDPRLKTQGIPGISSHNQRIIALGYRRGPLARPRRSLKLSAPGRSAVSRCTSTWWGALEKISRSARKSARTEPLALFT